MLIANISLDFFRMGMLRLSRDSLPTSLVLVEDQKLIGHIKIRHLASRPYALWIESVVIDKSLRGKGYGKVLMLKTEEYVKDMGFQVAYLATYDQQGFYSRLGYEECEDVCTFDKPIDEWVPKTAFLKDKVWNVGRLKNDKISPPKSNRNSVILNGFEHLQNGHAQNGYSRNGYVKNGKKSKTNGHSQNGISINGIEEPCMNENGFWDVDENESSPIVALVVNGNGYHDETRNGHEESMNFRNNGIPKPPPMPSLSANVPASLLMSNKKLAPPPPPPPPPPRKVDPNLVISPIKAGVAVPAPPPKAVPSPLTYLSNTFDDPDGLKTFMKKPLT